MDLNSNSEDSRFQISVAQHKFRYAISDEISLLMKNGFNRAEATQMLLHRLACIPPASKFQNGSTSSPDRHNVHLKTEAMKVAETLQISFDEAFRILIIQEEVRKLKSQGLNTLAAIELLTNRVSQTFITKHGGNFAEPLSGFPLSNTQGLMRDCLTAESHKLHLYPSVSSPGSGASHFKRRKIIQSLDIELFLREKRESRKKSEQEISGFQHEEGSPAHSELANRRCPSNQLNHYSSHPGKRTLSSEFEIKHDSAYHHSTSPPKAKKNKSLK